MGIACGINIGMVIKIWQPVEEQMLREFYHATPTNILCQKLGRTWSAIKLKAQRMNLCRSHQFRRENDLSALCDLSTPEALYWFGFLLADGHFTKKRIVVNLAKKDRNHLVCFAKFVKCPNIKPSKTNLNHKQYLSYKVAVQDIDRIPGLVQKFNIQSDKTHNPPNLTSLLPEELFCVLIGFFDGDGNIQKRVDSNGHFGRIKCHAAWLPIFKYFRSVVSNITSGSRPKLNKQGYAIWHFSATQLYQMKAMAMDLGLPLMIRKWGQLR